MCGVHRHGGRTGGSGDADRRGCGIGHVGHVLICGRLLLLTLVFGLGCESRKVIKARPVVTPSAAGDGESGGGAVREPTSVDPPADPSAEPITCGLDGLPECPLQYWMDHRLSGPLSRQDFPNVARAFRDLANAEPPGYAGWRLWAQGGAVAADREDAIGIRRACSGCHDTYRERYRRTIRARPMQIVDPP